MLSLITTVRGETSHFFFEFIQDTGTAHIKSIEPGLMIDLQQSPILVLFFLTQKFLVFSKYLELCTTQLLVFV